MQTALAILTGRLISAATKALKLGGGSAAPGLYALKIDPNLVSKLSSKIKTNIVITGTNGKTTTSRMIAHFAKVSNLKVIRNHTGSNLERGIASTLVQNLRLHPWGVKLNYDLGIWELDEAAFNSIAPKLSPKIIVFLNVFRDQLDRYGEVDTVVKRWCETLKSIDPKTIVLVNGDDANTLKLKSCFKGKVETFGVENYKLVGESIEKYKSKQRIDYEAKNVNLNGLNGSQFKLTINNQPITINLPLPGIYHIYDAMAALSVSHFLDFSIKNAIQSFKNFVPAFGRVEQIKIEGKDSFIFLIKNPAGATQVFETISPQLKKDDRILLALNDNLADGTDVSWIWDANFEKLRNLPRAESMDFNVISSGVRAYDLGVRLKYAGFEPNTITINGDLKKAFREATDGLKGRLFILPTYTALLQLQELLTDSGAKGHYWEE